jgi:hypothetical protein
MPVASHTDPNDRLTEKCAVFGVISTDKDTVASGFEAARLVL